MSDPIVIRLFCSCGAGAEGEIAPAAAAQKFLAFWRAEHQGDGHRECGKDEAMAEFRRREGHGPE